MNTESNYRFAKAVGEIREKAILLHHERYQEVGFLQGQESDQYEQDAEYFVAQSEDGSVVGVIRLIFREMKDLPTMANFKIFDLERTKLMRLPKNKFVEVSAFTKMPQHDVGLGLIKSIVQYSFANDITHWICCIDERVFRYMERMFKFPFKVIGEPEVYMGSLTIPCVLDLQEADAVVSQQRPKLYSYLTTAENKKLEAVKS